MTTNNPIPESVQKHFMCKLLHTKTLIWDGDYRYDESAKKNIPNIKHTCKICDKGENNG